MNDPVILRSATIKKIEETIIENIIHDNVTIDTEDILEIKKINKELSGGKYYSILVDSGNYTSITEAGKALAASKDFQEQTIAKALLVRSLSQRIIGRFYLKVNRPAIKTRMFSCREQAIEWLRGVSAN